jgi:antitoxin YefM
MLRIRRLAQPAASSLDLSGTTNWCNREGVWVVAVSASEARSGLLPLIRQVNDDHTPVLISSRGGDAVLMSAEDFDSWQETIYLLGSPANARRLMEALAKDRAGQVTVAKTMEELQDLAGE